MIEHHSEAHSTLARSYLVYFVASMLGLFADGFINLDFELRFAEIAAFVCLGAGPLLMAWAQYTSWQCKSATCEREHYFNNGPYKYMRNPTHLALLILVTGYTLVSGSVVFFLITLLGYLVSNQFFKKYEKILQRIYGAVYENYKSAVKRF